jgi:ComF family protein
LPLETENHQLCGQCQKTPPTFNSAFIPFRYEHPVDQWIWKFKFRNDLVSGKLLADLFLKKLLESRTAMPEILVPVPLHSSRVRQRGFNQSLWLARHIGKQLGIPVDSRSVRRRLKTPPQHELNIKKRTTILRNAFTLKGDIAHQHIAVVDDVLTSGSTMNEISKQLRHNGCTRIDCWAIARTPLK